MPGTTNKYPLTLDGAAVQVSEQDTPRLITIPAGEFATPFWITVVGGITVRVDALPWQGVLPPP